MTGAELFVLDDTLAPVPGLFPAAGSSTAASASFGPYDHPVGFTAFAVVYATANKVGNASATATIDWNATINQTQYPLLPYSVTETVSINKPF